MAFSTDEPLNTNELNFSKSQFSHWAPAAKGKSTPSYPSHCKTDPEHFQPLLSQCDMHMKLPHQATFALPGACFPTSMGSKSPIKYKEWMKALLRLHLTKIENDQKLRKAFLKNLIVVDFLLWAPGQSYHPSRVFAPPKQV